jgi:glycerol 2-dehydrogenase (NADP+)
MTKDWKADKSLNWLDTWRKMEKVYREHPGKVKAIGMQSRLKTLPQSSTVARQ